MAVPSRRVSFYQWTLLSVSLFALLAAMVVQAQQPTPPTSQAMQPAVQPAMQKAEPPIKPASNAAAGIPVTSDAVRTACGACHVSDASQRMTRISYRRATPEGWEQTIKRMISLNGLQLEPAQAREIVKYLADHHGLAPEEAAPAAFEVERRQVDHKYPADRDTEETCTKCHSMGRVLAERRTKEDWGLLIAMHRGYYPLVDSQGFRRMSTRPPEPGPDGRAPDTRQPMDKAIEHLAKALPLTTPEWAAWSATMRTPKLAGRWAISGYEVGKGPLYGEMTIVAPAAAGAGTGDAFTTELRYTYARSGEQVIRKGRSVVYTGFQWRGRSFASSVAPAKPGAPAKSSTATASATRMSTTMAAAPGQPSRAAGAQEATAAGTASADEGLREVMSVDRAWREMKGRWFTGAYNERGIDVTLTRVDASPVVLGAGPVALESGGTRELTLYGANLPVKLAAADLDLGPGVRVARVVSARPDAVKLQVEVAAAAAPGPRDLFVGGAARPAAFVVYDRIDAVRVKPQAGLSRVGGATMPKQMQQFEAVALYRGADGKPGTADDVELGLVDAAWSLEEYATTLTDDDLAFVGAIDPASGLFTPNVDGPNPKRSGNRNNVGDVWVIATVKAKDADGQPKTIRARAHLLVTVPLYLNWERKTEASQ